MGVNPSVALMGLGLMGSGMAGRLLEAKYPLTLYNRTRERALPFAQKGARVANTPRDAADGANVVISMVADDDASRALWLGPDGALAGVLRGATLIECSTLSVAWVKELGDRVAKENANLTLLDAPVTGSKPQAAAGQLFFLV